MICQRILADSTISDESKQKFHVHIAQRDVQRVEGLLATKNKVFVVYELLLEPELLLNMAALHQLAPLLLECDLKMLATVTPGVFWLLLHPDDRLRRNAFVAIEYYRSSHLSLDPMLGAAQAIVDALSTAFSFSESSIVPTFAALGLLTYSRTVFWRALSFLLGTCDPEFFRRR